MKKVSAARAVGVRGYQRFSFLVPRFVRQALLVDTAPSPSLALGYSPHLDEVRSSRGEASKTTDTHPASERLF
jgi:hypothetical protein